MNLLFSPIRKRLKFITVKSILLSSEEMKLLIQTSFLDFSVWLFYYHYLKGKKKEENIDETIAIKISMLLWLIKEFTYYMLYIYYMPYICIICGKYTCLLKKCMYMYIWHIITYISFLMWNEKLNYCFIPFLLAWLYYLNFL